MRRHRARMAENSGRRQTGGGENAAPASRKRPRRPWTRPAAPVPTPAPAPAPTTPGGRTHTVVSGDTLSGLALRYYGNAVRWAEIYDANRNQLPNERALRIGMELVIP